jgi:enterochelin esterase family protein
MAHLLVVNWVGCGGFWHWVSGNANFLFGSGQRRGLAGVLQRLRNNVDLRIREVLHRLFSPFVYIWVAMKKLIFLLLCLALPATAAEKFTAAQLIALANSHDAGLVAAIGATFDTKDVKAGTAWVGHGPDFFFATEAASQPMLTIDDETVLPMQAVSGANPGVWYAVAHIEPVGTLHSFHYLIDGKSFGGRLDLPAYAPLWYLQPGVPSGTLSEKIVHTSKIYEGMKSNYWIYVPAQYDPKTPAALMVFQDGGGYINRGGDHGVLDAIDNLIALKKIPVMICVFINPGSVTDAQGTATYALVKDHSERMHRTLDDAMRSTLYDTVSDRYDRFLRDEILADVGAKYDLRKDAYSRAITGASSGGICSFNAAWQSPDEVSQFSRVLSWIGSFTSIQWKERADVADGGQDYPDKVLREAHRNIRVWLQDGANDMENPGWGSWPLANIRMANALKTKGYDFHFSFGKGAHNDGHGAAEFPEAMIWLWRDYDAAKTDQVFEMDPEEKAKPFFRVAITNR